MLGPCHRKNKGAPLGMSIPYSVWVMKHEALEVTQTYKQEYALARDKEPCRGLQEREKYHKAKYVKHHVCFVSLQSSLHENVVFSVYACMGNAAYVYIYHVEFHFQFGHLITYPV